MQNRKRDTDVQNRLLDSVGEGEGGMFWENSVKTSTLSRVKQITSPGCMRQVLRAGALGRPRGMGWGGRWEGGSGWGTHVNPWLIHVNVWQKPLQYCKVISLQLIKINEKKKIKARETARTLTGPLGEGWGWVSELARAQGKSPETENGRGRGQSPVGVSSCRKRGGENNS